MHRSARTLLRCGRLLHLLQRARRQLLQQLLPHARAELRALLGRAHVSRDRLPQRVAVRQSGPPRTAVCAPPRQQSVR
jgi:hypothetical protein